MNTATFTLLSGVDCEISEFTAKHQRILTEQTKKKIGDNLNEIIADILVRVGSETGPFTIEFVKALLSADRKLILVEGRKLALGSDRVVEEGETIEENVFTFTYDYVDSEDNKQSIEKEVELENGGNFPMKPYGKQWEEYKDIEKDVTFTLPDGVDCVFKMLDGYAEEVGNSIPKKDRSSHTPLITRNIRLMLDNGDKTKKLPFAQRSQDLDKWSLKNIEALRRKIKEVEGRVDTEERFEHPEAERKPVSEKYVTIDLLGIVAFFFPSQAI